MYNAGGAATESLTSKDDIDGAQIGWTSNAHEDKQALGVSLSTPTVNENCDWTKMSVWGTYLCRTMSVSTKTLLTTTLVVGAGTLVVYIITALKEIVVAHRFGTSDGLDIFLVAFAIPAFAVNVIATSIHPAFIPAYIRCRQEHGDAAAQHLSDNVQVFLSFVLVTLSIVLAVCSGWLIQAIAPGFSASKLAMAHSMFLWLLPSIVLRGLAKAWAAVLNANDHYAAVALSPIGAPVLIIALAMGAGLGIYALIAGTLTGAIAEAAMVGSSLYRLGTFRMPRWHGLSNDFRDVLRQYIPAGCATFLMAAGSILDQWSASKLKSGSIAMLSYGTYVVIFLQQTASVALNAAVLPTFSRLALARNYAGLRRSLMGLSGLVLFVTIPMTLALICLSRPLISLLFQHGAFTVLDALAASRVQVFYCLQMPFYVLTVLVLRCLVAMSWNRALLWGAVANLTVKLTLNAVLTPVLGVAGIALATSLMYVSSFFIHFCWLRQGIRAAESI